MSLRTPARGLARLAFSAKVRDSGALSVCGTNGRGLGLARDEMLNKLRHPLSRNTRQPRSAKSFAVFANGRCQFGFRPPFPSKGFGTVYGTAVRFFISRRERLLTAQRATIRDRTRIEVAPARSTFEHRERAGEKSERCFVTPSSSIDQFGAAPRTARMSAFTLSSAAALSARRLLNPRGSNPAVHRGRVAAAPPRASILGKVMDKVRAASSGMSVASGDTYTVTFCSN